MIYDWSVGFSHQYFGVTLDYAGGAVSSAIPLTMVGNAIDIGLDIGI